MGIDYQRASRPIPEPETTWLILGVKVLTTGLTFTFLDSKTVKDTSPHIPVFLVDLDKANRFTYCIVVNQREANQRGWLKRYQTRL